MYETKKEKDLASVCLFGKITDSIVKSGRATHFNVAAKSPGGTVCAHIRVPADIPVESGGYAFVFNGALYQSKDDPGADLAVNVPAGGLALAQDIKGHPQMSISLIGTVSSKIRMSETHAEFVMTVETVSRPVNLHIVAELDDAQKWVIQKGDKIGIFGGSIDKCETDRKTRFVVRVGRKKVHLIPYYDGLENADEI